MAKLFAKLPHRFADAFQVGIDLQRLQITSNRVRHLPEMRVTVPHPRPRAEMSRHSPDRLLAVRDRLLVALLKVTHDRPLVVRLGETRIGPDRLGKKLLSLREFTSPQRLGASAHQRVGLRRAATKPD